MRCLVTGSTGFVGRHLVRALRADGYEVFGLTRPGSADRDVSEPEVYAVDLVDTESVVAALVECKPDWIFHLAGFASPGDSFREPDAAWTGNLRATISLYNAIAHTGRRPRILYVSSGLIYGDSESAANGLAEDAILKPASPYAASKAAADLLSFQQTCNPGLDIVRVRPFNQIGPGQSTSFAVANFARQIAAIRTGQQSPVVQTGDLSAYRDYTDVRDMVRAYVRLLEVGRSGDVFNAGSGRAIQMRDILLRLIEVSGIEIAVEERSDPTRAGDTNISRADIRKITAATGWSPTTPIDTTLADMLEER